jgi:hypothetical protein
MIITLKTLVSEIDEDAQKTTEEAYLGRKPSTKHWTYSEVGMWALLICSATLSVVGLVVSIVSAFNERTFAIAVGVFIQLVGTYLLIAAMKEKSNLDFVTKHLQNVSVETRDEIFRTIMKNNSRSSRDILQLIEKLFNVVFKKGKQ